MSKKRKIEVFTAGCPVCKETVEMINHLACSSCDVSVLDMSNPEVAERAKSIGIRTVPAVLIDGKLANCCSGQGPDKTTLRRAGLGKPIKD
ncbi:MAG: thioredoxin family protein [Candidatus Aminicenantales bacterium]